MTTELTELIGKTIARIEQMDTESLIFNLSDGTRYQMWHSQDCCESVYIESIVGDLDDLVGSPILKAEVRTSDENPLDGYSESHTWTFYALATIKGYVDIRWYGSSNGYYSESVQFDQI